MGKFEQPRNRKPAGKTRAASAQRRHSGKRQRSPRTILIAVAAVAVALVIGVVGYALAISKSGSIFPNVYVAGVNVGGMSREEAIPAVQAAVDQTYGISTLAVKLPDRTVSFEPADVKVSLDVESAVEAAWQFGRDQGLFKTLALRKAAGAGEQFINIEDSLSLDEDFVRRRIDETAQEAASERRDSTYEIVETELPADGDQAPVRSSAQLVIQVGASQRSLDTDALYDAVVAAFMNNDFTPLEFSYDETPYTPVDLDSLYKELCTDMADAYYDAEKKVIVDEIVGYGFDLAAAKQKQAMAEEGSTLTLELSEIAPEVTRASLEEKLFHDVLAKYDSQHVYNPSRTNNLDLACKAIDGTVLNPGDIFSFNDTVGERTAAKGYQAAIVYVTGDSKPELGGGICQVASTIYVCTLLADLNVTERLEHMYTVSYVPMGADATIYWDSKVDFKFENSTSYPLRIDASVSDGYVHIALVGTKENDETIKLFPVTTSVTQWKDVEKVDETQPADYSKVTVTPYTGYRVTLYIQRYDANGNPIGERELAQHPYSVYHVRDRVTTVGKKPEEPTEPTQPTEPTEPTAPTEPTQPTEPTVPTEPVQPTEPEPSEPTEPDVPSEPDPDSPYDPFTSGNGVENLE